jgi:hypothetical protein
MCRYGHAAIYAQILRAEGKMMRLPGLFQQAASFAETTLLCLKRYQQDADDEGPDQPREGGDDGDAPSGSSIETSSVGSPFVHSLFHERYFLSLCAHGMRNEMTTRKYEGVRWHFEKT